MKHFIVGYGSLFKTSSLHRTLPDVKISEPIYLKHYVRSWEAVESVMKTYSSVFLGARYKKNSQINAVIFEVNDQELKSLDKREFLYTRKPVRKKSSIWH